MRRLFSSVAVVGLILAFSAGARAEETVLTLQEGLNGYSGCVDTTLMGAAPTRNYGGATYLRTWRGSDPGAPRQNKHTIIKYDLSSVPTDKYIVSAKLEVYCYQLDWPSADPKVVAKMITRSWVEGASNGSEGVAGATWYEHDYYDHDATSQNDWAVVGGDFDPTVLDMQSLGSGQWISLDVTDALRAHLFGVSDNNGLAIVPADEAGGANDARFYSSEYATDTALRPKLVITYTEGDPNPPEPPEPPANQLVLQQAKDGYTGCTDTSLSGSHPTMNTGRSRSLYTWRGSSNDNPRKNKSAVVKFDLATVPADKYIVSAKLEVYCHALAYPSAEPKASVKTVTRSWVEGEGHNQAGVPGATWYEHDYFDHDATAQNDWTTRGGEFGATVLDSQPIVVDEWLSFDVTATVRAMKAETQDNHGFAIVPFDEGSGVNNASYYSSEYNFDASLRPKLVLVLAEEEELSFQEGDGGDYSNTENAYIRDDFPTVPHNFSLVAGKSGGATACALVRFPDAIGRAAEQIPHDAIIIEAKLTLTNTFAENQPISAYRVTDGWTYYSIVPTWSRRRLAFTNWTVEGCGYTDESTKSRTNTIEDTVTCTQAYTAHDWDITAAVQAWVDDANLNKGLILENRAATDFQVFYSSDEAQFESYRPVLTVKFYRADIQAPKLTMTESPTSNTAQAFIEGTKDPEVDTISLTADGQPVDVVVTNSTSWHAFVERGESDSVQLVATSEDTNGNQTQVTETLTYDPLEAGSDDGIMMQAGNSMLVVVHSEHQDADSVEIDSGDGTNSIGVDLGEAMALPYDEAGEYTSTFRVLDENGDVLESHEIEVTAVSVTLKPSFALGIKVSQFYNPTVYYEVEVTPASAKDQIHLLTEDEDLLTVQPRETTDTGVKSEVVLEKVSTPYIQARLGGLAGRVVGREGISSFTSDTSFFVGNRKTREGKAYITMEPLLPDLEVEIKLGFGATYLDETDTKTFTSADFDPETGRLFIDVIMPESAAHFETTVRTYQTLSPRRQIGGFYRNKGCILFGLREQVFVEGEIPPDPEDPQPILFGEEAQGEGKESKGMPHTVDAEIWLVDRDGVMPGKNAGDRISPPDAEPVGEVFFRAGSVVDDYPEADVDSPHVEVPSTLLMGVYDAIIYVPGYGEIPFPNAVVVVPQAADIYVVPATSTLLVGDSRRLHAIKSTGGVSTRAAAVWTITRGSDKVEVTGYKLAGGILTPEAYVPSEAYVEIEVEGNAAGVFEVDATHEGDTAQGYISFLQIELVEETNESSTMQSALTAKASLLNAVMHSNTDPEGIVDEPDPSATPEGADATVDDVVVTGTSDNTLSTGTEDVAITVTGQGFENGASVYLSREDVRVKSVVFVTAEELTAVLEVDAGASFGTVYVTVTNPGGLPSDSRGELRLGLALDCEAAAGTPYPGRLKLTPTAIGEEGRYGYLDASQVSAVTRSTGTDLTKDHHASDEERTLEVAVEAGRYHVSLNIGDTEGECGPFDVKCEAEEKASAVQTTQGQMTESAFQVSVTDGRLSLTFSPAQDKRWCLAGVTITRVDGTGQAVSDVGYVTSATPTALEFAYSAESGMDLSGGELRMTIPKDWTVPQTDDPTGAGYVSVQPTGGASVGQVSITGRIVLVGLTTMSSGHGLTIRYGDTDQGGAGASCSGMDAYWFTMESRGAGGSFKALEESPVVTAASNEGPQQQVWDTVPYGKEGAAQAEPAARYGFRTADPEVSPVSKFRVRLLGEDLPETFSGEIEALSSRDAVLDQETFSFVRSAQGNWWISDATFIVYTGELEDATKSYFSAYALLDPTEPSHLKIKTQKAAASAGVVQFAASQGNTVADFDPKSGINYWWYRRTLLTEYPRNAALKQLRSPGRCLRINKPIYLRCVNKAWAKLPNLAATLKAKHDDTSSTSIDLVMTKLGGGVFQAAVVLADAKSQTAVPPRIKIVDEDLLTLAVTQGEQTFTWSIMVDVREAGADYAEDYSVATAGARRTPGLPEGYELGNLKDPAKGEKGRYSRDFAKGFLNGRTIKLGAKAIKYNGVKNAPGHYQQRFDRMDQPVSRAAWKAGTDNIGSGADTVDIALICVHGDTKPVAGDEIATWTFSMTQAGGLEPKLPDFQLSSKEIILGDRDLEYWLCGSCYVGKASKKQWTSIMRGGLHVAMTNYNILMAKSNDGGLFAGYCVIRHNPESGPIPAGQLPIGRAWLQAEYVLRKINVSTIDGVEYKPMPVMVYYKGEGKWNYSTRKWEWTVIGTSKDVLPSDANKGAVLSPDYEAALKGKNEIEMYGWKFTRDTIGKIRPW